MRDFTVLLRVRLHLPQEDEKLRKISLRKAASGQ